MQRIVLRATIIVAMVALPTGTIFAAGYRTENFIVTAPSKNLAKEIGDSAESFRHNLAIEWLGQPLPRWPQPCPISVQVGPHMGAGGATSFMFEGRQPFGWRMNIQGSRERLLDSVLPHEVTHTIFATYFGRPLPRWADEGACTTVEHPTERARQQQFLIQFLRASPPRSIPFNQMFRMKEYPRDILPLYAQGHSVARYMIQQGGKRKFVQFVGRGMDTNNWDAATEEFYGYHDLSELQVDWIGWVSKGSPAAGTEQLASLGLGPQRRPANGAVATTAPAETLAVATTGRPGQMQPVPRSRVSQPTQVASVKSTPGSGGWYERQRDSARLAKVEGPLAKAMPAPSKNSNLQWLPGSARVASNELVPRAMARPQGPQQPSQTVLQWEKESLPFAAGPAVQLRRRQVTDPPSVYFDAPPSGQSQTMLR